MAKIFKFSEKFWLYPYTSLFRLEMTTLALHAQSTNHAQVNMHPAHHTRTTTHSANCTNTGRHPTNHVGTCTLLTNHPYTCTHPTNHPYVCMRPTNHLNTSTRYVRPRRGTHISLCFFQSKLDFFLSILLWRFPRHIYTFPFSCSMENSFLIRFYFPHSSKH